LTKLKGILEEAVERAVEVTQEEEKHATQNQSSKGVLYRYRANQRRLLLQHIELVQIALAAL